MVLPLGPGKFYGSSLPRPRIYTDVKLNDFRVDPPASVTDPLMSWAHEAHWSMGGLSFKRLRLQGRIEGNVTKLRRQQQKLLKTRTHLAAAVSAYRIRDSAGESDEDKSPSPPLAPMVTKRRRFLAQIYEEDEIDEEMKRGEREESWGGKRRRLARKLGDDFERVAAESGIGKSWESPATDLRHGSQTVASRTRSRRSDTEIGEAVHVMKAKSKAKKVIRVGEKANKSVAETGLSTPGSGVRSSPRLAKR